MHLAGYTFERACKNLDWLLTDNRWQACGFSDVNAWLKTIDWSDFKIAAEQRKEISRKLDAINASQRQIARTLGVGETTVRRDLAPQGAPAPKNPTENNPPAPPLAPNAAPTRSTQSGAEAQKAAEKKAPHDVLDGDPEWYTPPEIVGLARSAMGGIDLDPASNEWAQGWIKAATWYGEEQDGLAQEWAGRVWMNPPYSRGRIAKFVDKLLGSPAVTQAVDAHWSVLRHRVWTAIA